MNSVTFTNAGRMIMGVPASAVPPGTARLGGGEFLNAAAGQYIQQATGTTTIDGTFTNQGVVRNNDGAMTVGPGGTYRQLFQSIPFVDTRTVNNGTFTNAGTVQLDFGEFSNQGKIANSGTFQVAALAQVTGNGSYVQNAAAAQTIVNGTFSNNIALQQGLLTGTGTIVGDVVNTGGVVRAGDATAPGTLTLASYTQGANGRLDFRIGGLLVGTQYDFVRVNGPVTLNGTVQVSLINNFQPNIGDKFDILRGDRITLGQVNFSLPSLSSGETWFTGIVGNFFELSVAQAQISAPEPSPLLVMALGVAWLVGWHWKRRTL